MKEEFKLKEEHLIALIRGTKLSFVVRGIEISIIPPLYDDRDRFENAFEAGKKYQREAEMFLELSQRAKRTSKPNK